LLVAAMVAFGNAFDDARTKAIGDAFDAICGRLHGDGYPCRVREAIARRLIEIAGVSGENDPTLLAEQVIESLGIKV
jgi:hypothetical protein